jgi:hypothetical protein
MRLRSLLDNVSNNFKKLSYENLIKRFEEELVESKMLSENMKITLLNLIHKVYTGLFSDKERVLVSGQSQVRVRYKHRFREKRDSEEFTTDINFRDLDDFIQQEKVLLGANMI